METLATADGKPIDLDNTEAEFAAAMSAPRADEPEAPAPPRREPKDPDAPYGRKADGTPRGKPGRPPKARMIESAPAAKGGTGSKGKGTGTAAAGKTAQDYAQALGELLGGIQLALAVIPIPNANARVHARYQAAVIEQTGDGLATGLGTVAEHNATVRWGVEKLTQGGASWVLPAAMAIAPFMVSTAMLWTSEVTDEMRAGAQTIEDQAMAHLKAEMGFTTEPEPEAQPQPEAQPAAA